LDESIVIIERKRTKKWIHYGTLYKHENTITCIDSSTRSSMDKTLENIVASGDEQGKCILWTPEKKWTAYTIKREKQDKHDKDNKANNNHKIRTFP